MFLARPILTTIASKAAPWLISKAVGAVKGLVDKYVTHKDVNSAVNKVVDVYG